MQPLAASRCNWSLEELAGYSAVLLENTPANLVGHVGMENLAAWVAQSGGGLMLTGGRDSYGPGGYYKSPLEPILPVSMELRREHRKLSLAIVVALDRSGSMACTVPDGRQKIELADLATAEVLNMLGPTDQFGCIAVDVVPHEIVPFSDVVDKSGMRLELLADRLGRRRNLHLRGACHGGPDVALGQGRHPPHHPFCRCRRQPPTPGWLGDDRRGDARRRASPSA